jgi:hypothetical protein
MRHFRRHANALAQRGVRVDGLADVYGIRTHLDGQGDLADHVTRVGADHAAAQDLAVAVGFGAVVKQQLGDAFVAAIGNGAARCGPGEQVPVKFGPARARTGSNLAAAFRHAVKVLVQTD